MAKTTGRRRSRNSVPIVTRHIKRQRRRHRDLKKSARDPIVKQIWNNDQTVTQNMGAVTVEHLATALSSIQEHVASPTRVSEQDTKIIRTLVEAYGEDYEAMSRDRKLNCWQWTENQLRRLQEKIQVAKREVEQKE